MNNPLPKLNTAVYELKLPSTNTSIKFRPFLVKEYRALLTAKEDNNKSTVFSTVKALVDACTFNKLKIEELPLVDLEYIILKLRCKSIGEVVELNGRCTCGAKTPISINLEEITVKGEDVDHIIKITDDVAVKMMFPTTKIVDDVSSTKDQFLLIGKCIQQIYSGDDVFDAKDLKQNYIMEFLESLNQSQFTKLASFIEKQPTLSHEVKFTCEACGKENIVLMEGIDDFFI